MIEGRDTMKCRHALIWPGLAVVVSGCIASSVGIEQMNPSEVVGTSVESPFKAFLTDGRITVFPDGARVTTDSVIGAGTLYSLGLESFDPVEALSLDDVLGLESFQADVNIPLSVVSSVVGTAVVAVGALAALAVLTAVVFIGLLSCFLSGGDLCPADMFYGPMESYSESRVVLDAEAFLYTIVPLAEERDVNRIGVDMGADGVIQLELRNDAFRTQYINHVELLEVRHGSDRAAYPNEEGRILLVGETTAAVSAIDRYGLDRLGELSARDGTAFFSSDARIRAVTAEDFRDHVDLAFPRPDSQSAALVLRLRNSLLNTLLFQDLMLASQGAQALDWLGAELADTKQVTELDGWFQATLGLEISVRGPGGWERVARVADSGPLAWEEVAIQLPVPEGEELRVRLSFLADEWRIDYAGLAEEVEFAEPTVAALARVAPLSGAHDPELAAELARPDEDYVVMIPSGAISLESEPLGAYSGDERTFFLSSQGYYTEWIRPDWIRSTDRPEPFRPSGETVVRLMERWVEEKDEVEKSVIDTRVSGR